MSHNMQASETNAQMEFTFHEKTGTQPSTYFGRFMHFQRVVDPRNFFNTRKDLEKAMALVSAKRREEDLLGRPLLLS